MKPLRLLLVSLLLSVSFFALSQQLPPAIEWQKSLGGSGEDRARSILKTPDGGFMVVGFSESNDGDVTGHHGTLTVADAWAVKLNASGNIEWQRSLGGTGLDEFYSVILAPDGSYICLGITTSNDGDVSGNHGGRDYWLVNLSRQGNILWQRCLGGSGTESTSSVQSGSIRLINGFYYLIGSTSSNNGDVSGNHGGMSDIWFVKLALNGTPVQQMCFGGSIFDYGFDIAGAENGYFLLAVESASDDGTFGSMGANTPRGGIVKIDSTGHMVWKQVHLQRMRPVTLAKANNTIFYGDDMLVCVPNNNTSGFRTGYLNNVPGSGSTPGQNGIAEISTCQPNIGPPNYASILAGPTPIGVVNNTDLIVIGSTSDSTGVHGIHNGLFDGLLMGQKPNGTIAWKKLLGGTKSEFMQSVAIIDGTQFAVAGSSNSPNTGQVTGNHGDYDFWVVKLGQVNNIKGTVYFDYNSNGVKDASEPFINNILVESKKNTTTAGSLTFNGSFSNSVDTGSYTTKVAGSVNYYTAVPASYNSTFTTYHNVDSFSFGLQPIPGQRDYKINLYPVGTSRPGFDMNYNIVYSNIGTEALVNKTVRMIKDSRETFQSAVPAPLSVNGDTITWNISHLDPRQSGTIQVKLKIAAPPTVNIGDTLRLSALIDSTGDLAPANNFVQIRDIVRGAFDPNDKNESLGGIMMMSQVTSQELVYTIRFQNTGNDTAFTVVVRDTLDGKLDFNSIEMVSVSHAYSLAIKDGNKLTWTFDKILLVDSVHNEPLSHGYITYRIKPKSTVAIGDVISNSASIYFDFNLPVRTNTHTTEIKANPLVLPPPSPNVSMQNVYCGNLGVQKGKLTNLPSASSGITVNVSLNGNALSVAADSTFSFDVSAMSPGVYTLQVVYSNSVAADTLRRDVTIAPVATPDVNVSANITTAVNLVDPVIVTATNAAGGGSTPLYTFAKDRNITNVLQAEGSNNVLNINPTTLTAGDSWVYVRMKTSSTCYSSQFNIDSIKITMALPVPPQPVINGMQANYCNTLGTQKGKLGNYPAAGTGATVTVKLDGSAIALAADSSFSFNPSALLAGEHAIEVTFTNPSGTKISVAVFSIILQSTPDVNLATTKNMMSNDGDQATLTATNFSGGGTAPLYTFAKNRAFTQILQAESASSTYNVTWSSLSVGENWIYVRMKSNSTCITTPTALDSILIVKTGISGLVDPDFPGVRINSTPNPFRGQLMLSGLNAGKTYTITIHNMQGRQTFRMRVGNRTTASLHVPGYMAGTYLLSIYDETKKRLIGTIEIVKQ